MGVRRRAGLRHRVQGQRIALVRDPLQFSAVGPGEMFGLPVDTFRAIELERVPADSASRGREFGSEVRGLFDLGVILVGASRPCVRTMAIGATRGRGWCAVDRWSEALSEGVAGLDGEVVGTERDGEVLHEPDLPENDRGSLVRPRVEHSSESAP